MSERKVLNKYYPPDFDPSKVPKSKEKRNATFEIRLMAPCNMRCTTCGEYIYKGRKFNARKEDVDDMNYLGLRIYRFYIKCTACVSEICFRTDPATTDYIIEAGATRNFEALRKAEEIAEKEQEARKEELENNPMRLLEERTAASKHEMDLAESLEELKELNRRKTEINTEEIVNKLNNGRLAKRAEDEEIAKDEAFIAAAFRRDAVGGEKVKRILENSDSSSSGNEEEKGETAAKVAKTDNPTDHLVGVKVEKKKAVWEKSVGSIGASSKLGLLVKKKPGGGLVKPGGEPKEFESAKKLGGGLVKPGGSGTSTKDESAKAEEVSRKPAGPSGLGLLGAYSDSDNSSE